jgi:hypothetical protein
MLEIKKSVDEASVRKLIAEMKELEPTAIADLRRELKSKMKPFASQIQAQVPTSSPFKGMERNYYGRIQWAAPKVTISFTPGKRSRLEEIPLLTLIATNAAKLGFDYTETAGVRKRKPASVSRQYHRKGDSAPRRHKVTTQGDELIKKARSESKWNYKAGHFAYGKFLSLRPAMLVLVSVTLEATAKKFNVKMKAL